MDELEQPPLSGPLVHVKGNSASQGVAAHWAVVHGGHFFTHDVTSQQLSHMCCDGQKVALAEQPPFEAPLRHMYWSSTAQRFFDSQIVCEQAPEQLKRGGQAASEQHEVQNLVLFHALALAAHPPLLSPVSQ
jgi:hypothetical protein